MRLRRIRAISREQGVSVRMATAERTPWWAWVWPALAWVILVITVFAGAAAVIAAAAGVVLIATVFAAVYHAEVVAHRIGEPFGTLVLAVAVTVIEVALIVSVMLGGGGGQGRAGPRHGVRRRHDRLQRHRRPLPALGGVRHHEQGFQIQGASAALAVLAALTTLTLVVPNCHDHDAGSGLQHIAARLRRRRFAGALRLVRLRPDRAPPRLLPAAGGGDEDAHAPPPSERDRAGQRGLLLAALVAVVGLAKSLTPPSRRRLRGSARRRPWLGSSSPRWCCCPKAWRRCGRRGPTDCRPA